MSSSLTLELTKRYRMSLTDAAAVKVPCGLSAGELMGEQSAKSIYWFASCKTSTFTKPAMRDAICAARIIRASRQEQANEERWEKTKSHKSVSLADAKRVMVECLSCGRKSLIPRLILDRASRPKCFSCGGTLADLGGCVDEFVSAREAREEYGVTSYQLKSAADLGQVLCKREARRVLYGRASIENMLMQKASAGCH